MAAFTSKANGNWATSGQTTWTQVGVPGMGDSVTITHAITITADTVIGDGSNATVLTCLTGSLTVTGAKLTIRGKAVFSQYNAGTVVTRLTIQNSGSTPGGIELDSNASFTPVVSVDDDAFFSITGISSARCFFRTKSLTAGNAGRIVSIGNNRGLAIAAAYCDFARLGDSSNDGLTTNIEPSSNETLTFDHCTFDTCGTTPNAVILAASSTFSMTNCAWTNPVGSYGGRSNVSMTFNLNPNAISGGTRYINGCVFGGEISQMSGRDCTITNNYFAESLSCVGEVYPWALFDSNFVRKSTNLINGFEGNVTNCYVFHDPIAESPPIDIMHAGHCNCVVSANVFQYIGAQSGLNVSGVTDTEGQPLNYPSVTTNTTTISYNIFLPTPSPGDITLGGITSNETNSLWSEYVVIDHNAICVRDGLPMWMGLTIGQRTGSIPSLRSNIFYRTGVASPGPHAFQNVDSTPQVDAVNAAHCDYNCWLGLATVPGGTWSDISDGTVYSTPMSGGTAPGLHDQANVNPGFIDTARNLQAWSVHKGYATSGDSDATKIANAQAAIQADPTLTSTDLMPYIRAGFVPTNAALRAASYPGDSSTVDAALNAWAGGIPGIGPMSLAGSPAGFTLTGPSSGQCGAASSNFTITPASSYTGTITPSDGGNGGTFTPASLSWSSSATPKTFTYTPYFYGSIAISATASPLLTPPASISFIRQVQLGQSGQSPSGNQGPSLGGFIPTAGAWWTEINRNVTADAVSPENAAFLALIGGASIHCDFSTTTANGGNSLYGMPYNVVPGTQTLLPLTSGGVYVSEGDLGPVPYYAAMSVEGQAAFTPGVPLTFAQASSGADHHGLVFVRNEATGGIAKLYESYSLYSTDSGATWGVTGVNVNFDLATGAPRPEFHTSTDAAGLPVAPLLLRYDEVDLAVNHGRPIGHPIRCTLGVGVTRNTFVWPARHNALSGNGTNSGIGVPMGARLRLSSAWYTANIGGFNPVCAAIVTCLRNHGMIVADLGGNFFLEGVNDQRWLTADLFTLQGIPASAFEFIDNIYPPVTLTGPTSGTVGTPQTFTVHVVNDADSNFSTGLYVYWSLDGGITKTFISGGALDDTNRTVTATFTPLTDGPYQISIDYGGNYWMFPPNIIWTVPPVAGSLKVTCAHGQQAYAYTPTVFGTLNGATAWTISFFYQMASWETGALGDLVQIGGNPFAAATSGATVIVRAVNAGNTKSISQTVSLDTTGHHILISGSASGTSSIYIDGLLNATTASLGALLASNVQEFVGWDDASHAATLYLRDLAIWGSYSASAADALALATGTKTPATMATQATNYWTLNGPVGAVTAGTQGLADSLGSINLGGIFGAGALTYDAHVITSNPVVPVLMMTPYVDTTGYLLVIPAYLNPTVTAGGPVIPTSVFTNPAFTVAGSPVTPTRLPLDSLSGMVVYQFATPVTLGQAVTMSAGPGWAFTAAGAVGGTSAGGLGSTPLTCLNYAGTSRDSAVVSPALKVGGNAVAGGQPGFPQQIMFNWARRLQGLDPGYPSVTNWRGSGAVTSFDANNLPASFTGSSVAGYVYATPAGNGVDATGVPGLSGTLTLIHGDATFGVDATTHVLKLDLVTAEAGWTVGSPTVVNAGVWDAGTSTWHQIIKTYPVTWSTSGGYLNPNILLQIARVDGLGGAVAIPILANGQSELGVFEPSVTDQTIPATISYPACFDPLAVAPSFLARFAGAHAIRWLSTQVLSTTTGDGDLCYAADLDIRKSTDFLATNTTTTTLDITRIDPVSLSVPTAIIADYINGDSTGTIPVALTPTRGFNAFCLCTTASPHGLRTGDRSAVTEQPVTARAAVINQAFVTIVGNINNSQTTITLSEVTNINGYSLASIFNGYILQIGSATTDEQVIVTGPLGAGGIITSNTVTVTRGARGTTPLAKSSGTVAYPCLDVFYGASAGEAVFVTSSTQFLIFLFNRMLPSNTATSSTLLYAQTYSHGACPTFSKKVPFNQGTSSYELCSRANSQIVAANPSNQGICWVSVPLLATDGAVTAAVNKMTDDFTATPGMRLLVQCSNEVFNGGFDQNQLASILCINAPNPQSGGTGFAFWGEYWASRQHHFNTLARAAFTAAGLDPNRVVWYQNGLNQGSVSQPVMQAIVAFCQKYSLPIQNISVAAYADMGNDMAATYVSWLPASTGVTGATATWSLATARKVMMSNYRASMRYGVSLAIPYVDAAKSLSRYNNGISVDGSVPANTNSVHGRLCIYEGATTQPLPIPFPGASFPHCGAWTLAMQYDPEWYQTERAFYQVLQDGAYQYALLMGSNFPTPADAAVEFICYFDIAGTDAPISDTDAYMYTMYRWQQQKAGYGDGSHGGVVNRLDFWDPTTPVNHDMTANGGILAPTINESVRGQAFIDWMGALSPPTNSVSAHDRMMFGELARTKLYHVYAQDTGIFHDFSLERLGLHPSASDLVTFTEAVRISSHYVVGASDLAYFQEQVLFQGAGGTARDTFIFRDHASVSLYFGRFRRGDRVPMIFTLPTTPDYAPVAVVFDQLGHQVSSFSIPTLDSDRLVFSYPMFVSLAHSLSRFTVYLHYVVRGSASVVSATFDVIAGGDSGGDVISVFSVDRPEARSLVAQLSSGRLVVGANPRL